MIHLILAIIEIFIGGALMSLFGNHVVDLITIPFMIAFFGSSISGIVHLLIFAEYCSSKDSYRRVMLSFNKFMDFYTLAKEKYILDSGWLHTIYFNRKEGGSQVYKIFFITIIDCIRFCLMKQGFIRIESSRQKREDVINYLEEVQRDLDAVKEKSEDQIQAAYKQMKEVSERSMTL